MILAIFFNFMTIVSAQAMNCSILWTNGYPDVVPTHRVVECDEFFPIYSPRVSEQRFFTTASLTHNVLIKQQMEWIAEAVSYSVDKFRMYGRVPPITVVRSDTEHPNGGGASAMAFTYVQFFNPDSESCPIFVYPISEILSKEHTQQLVAHEVFHCVQKVNFKDQTTVGVNASEYSFWFEGMAQYFSNVVYPSYDFEYTSRFPAPDQALPFFDQLNSYSSENFWQSYANLVGDNRLFNIMSDLPTSDGVQVSTIVNSFPRISEALHEYGKQITQKKVRDSSGRMSPYDMPLESIVLNDVAHQEINLSHYDFTVGGYRLTLPKAGRWTLRFNHPDNTKISLKKIEDEFYQAVDRSVQFTSECDQERQVQIVITRASDSMSMNSTRLIVDKQVNQECDCLRYPDSPPQVDQCLIGNWVLDHMSVHQFWERTNTNSRVQFISSTGGFGVNFSENNVGTWTASNWDLYARGQLNAGMIMHFHRITNGVSTFRYSANGSVACSSGLSMNMTAVQRIDVNGRTGTTTNVLPLDPSNGSFTYSCSEADFIFRVYNYNGGSQQVDYVFHRL